MRYLLATVSLVYISLHRLSSVLRSEGSARERMDYNSSCDLTGLGRKTEENRLHLCNEFNKLLLLLVHSGCAE